MLQRFVSVIEKIIFWLTWPALYVYLRLSPGRSRILVIAEGEVLLLRGLLTTGRYKLPGGGAKRGEPMIESAIRELKEETSIVVSEDQLQYLGTFKHVGSGFRYMAHYYILLLPEKVIVKAHLPEVLTAQWLPIDNIKPELIDDDTSQAISLYDQGVHSRTPSVV